MKEKLIVAVAFFATVVSTTLADSVAMPRYELVESVGWRGGISEEDLCVFGGMAVIASIAVTILLVLWLKKKLDVGRLIYIVCLAVALTFSWYVFGSGILKGLGVPVGRDTSLIEWCPASKVVPEREVSKLESQGNSYCKKCGGFIYGASIKENPGVRECECGRYSGGWTKPADGIRHPIQECPKCGRGMKDWHDWYYCEPCDYMLNKEIINETVRSLDK